MVHAKHPLGWPSSTEILSPWDLRWLKFFYKKHQTFDAAEKAGEEARNRGTRYHEGVEVLMNGGSIENALSKVTDNEVPALRSFNDWRLINGLVALDTEGHISSEKHKYYGSFDGLCKLEDTSWITEDFWHNPVPTPVAGTRFVVDHKTIDDRLPNDGEIKKHAMQLASYGNGLEEKFGMEFPYGIILYADMQTAVIKPIVIHPLSVFFKPFLQQRSLMDLIDSKGEYEHLRRRKTK